MARCGWRRSDGHITQVSLQHSDLISFNERIWCSVAEGCHVVSFTPRHYVRRYQLNVAQYGEILIAEAFHGRKLGDGQRGYHIATSKEAFIDALHIAGIDAETPTPSRLTGQIHIQVKSKLNQTASGRATGVLCKDTDLEAMTHLAVVLVHPGARIPGGDPMNEGLILQAWLLTRDRAVVLRQKLGMRSTSALTN
jgi:hypothetical protein